MTSDLKVFVDGEPVEYWINGDTVTVSYAFKRRSFMFTKVIAGGFLVATFALLGAFLFRLIPFDFIGGFTFVILAFSALISLGLSLPKKTNSPLVMPVSSENVHVAIAGQTYTGKSLKVMQLRDGGLLVMVDLGPLEPDPEPDKKLAKKK